MRTKKVKNNAHTVIRPGTKEIYHQLKILSKLDSCTLIGLLLMICCKFVAILMSIGCILLGNSIDVNERERDIYMAMCNPCSFLAHMN